LDGIACRRSTRGDLQFLVNRGHMDIDGFGANHESFCDLLVGQPSREQAQHLDFTSCQSMREGGGGRSCEMLLRESVEVLTAEECGRHGRGRRPRGRSWC